MEAVPPFSLSTCCCHDEGGGLGEARKMIRIFLSLPELILKGNLLEVRRRLLLLTWPFVRRWPPSSFHIMESCGRMAPIW
jgi:hypothetical protein